MKRTLLSLLAVALPAVSAELVKPPGVMLRHGEWSGGVGSFERPTGWEDFRAAKWPMDGWHVLVVNTQAATLSVEPMKKPKQQLKPILDQLELLERQSQDQSGQSAEFIPTGMENERSNELYVRVPGVAFKPGVKTLYRFKNGTSAIFPELGHRYQLKLGTVPFAFTVQNGFRTADGRPYGEGVQFRLELDGQRYDYDLGGYGWDVQIQALGDFDGDGKPDFLFSIGGSNSSHEAIVLSSQAKPGKNPPTTYLSSHGC